MATKLGEDHTAYKLLSRAHSPSTAQTIFKDKVVHKPLILRPTSPDPTSQDARAKRRLQRIRKKEHLRRRLKPKPLSAKEKRMLGIYDIPKEDQKYEIYEPLNRMWIGYMWEILGLKEGRPTYLDAQAAGPKLASADYHGAELEVVRSRCVGRVGCKGIVVKDTKFTFEMVTKHNTMKTVPKKQSIFRFEIPQPAHKLFSVDCTVSDPGPSNTSGNANPQPLIFELHGSQFETRAIDRATKKFKQKRLDDI
ncbi:hypothetical protein MMC13_001090 [Lambiella insularis]|nr:hypothetical protein [Lambiella insularis]